VSGGNPRRFADGDEERRAQSSGLWPGVSSTFLRGLEGTEVCVGGGAREKVAFVGVRLGSWIGERMGGDIRPWVLGAGRRGGAFVPREEEARCAEFGAGKEGGAARVEARCGELSAGNEGVEERVKVGTVGVWSSSVRRAGGECCFGDGFLKGGGGGGMAFRSSSALLMLGGDISSLL